MPVCDGVSDWPLQTCNIILYVSAASIGYTGPALHQAVALAGNIININTGELKTNAPSAPYFLFFTSVYNYLDAFGREWRKMRQACVAMRGAQTYCLLLQSLVGLR